MCVSQSRMTVDRSWYACTIGSLSDGMQHLVSSLLSITSHIQTAAVVRDIELCDQCDALCELQSIADVQRNAKGERRLPFGAMFAWISPRT